MEAATCNGWAPKREQLSKWRLASLMLTHSCFSQIKAAYTPQSDLRIPVSIKLVLRHLQMQMSSWLPNAGLFGFFRMSFAGSLKSHFCCPTLPWQIVLVFSMNIKGLYATNIPNTFNIIVIIVIIKL